MLCCKGSNIFRNNKQNSRKMKIIKDKKAFDAQLLATQLANECYQRDNKSKNTTNRGYDGTIRQNTITAVLADKTAIVYERLTCIGYFKIVFMLFKIAFLHKKLNGTTPVFKGVVTE